MVTRYTKTIGYEVLSFKKQNVTKKYINRIHRNEVLGLTVYNYKMMGAEIGTNF